ncbi:uncharacterized protein MELLADRAFT_77441 [Melampsora larici-populina 98AG31]|uniref:Uncharacterized protein n=1 Tax=Melampsora larici-populina (strain 98AG31 / pathotype 3-4-7) TaxID=747676 RepID=F4RHR3_MELLP|nr:uncharacterized protein MELLADRAFT_77441 [Melampsora larici-populina 98AG31]EGG08087.1 hypothetical protein MELLADRAFT_77441 [Melampsora larici-populina 98AG31]
MTIQASIKSKNSTNHSSNLIKRTRHTDQARLKMLIDNLQLRLNYAKLKVSHGWHTHTFNQVETLYSTRLHQPSTSSTSSSSSTSTSSPPTIKLKQSNFNFNPSSQSNSHSLSKSNQSNQTTLLDLALTKSKSNPSTPQPSSFSSPSSSSPSNHTEPFNQIQLNLNQDLHSFLLPHHQVSPNQSFFSNSNQIFGTPLTKSSSPHHLETPNPFKSITSTDRKMSKSLISLFPNLLNSEQTNHQMSEIWKLTNTNPFSPITFNKNSSTSCSKTLKDFELIETQTPITNKFHSIKHSHSNDFNLTSISPLRFSLNSSKKSGLRKSLGKISAGGLNFTSQAFQNVEIEETQDQISLDDLDSINWTSK